MTADDEELVGFGERIRAARERLGLSQVTVAEHLATDAGTVSRWERGKGYPQAPQLARLAMVLGESLDHLVLGAASDKQPITMPPALLEFLETDRLGRIAQERRYLPTLLSIRTTREPTVQFYRAIVAGLLAGDDG